MKTITPQYIAGFFDGEGSVGLYHNSGVNMGACLRTQLTQNKTRESTELLSYLRDRYGGNISEQVTGSGFVKYNWQLNPRGIKAFLEDIGPWLVLKQTQAQLALHWLDNRPLRRRDNHGRALPFTAEERQFTSNVIKLMKLLKRRDLGAAVEAHPNLVGIATELKRRKWSKAERS